MDYPKFSSFEVQDTIGEGKSAVAGAEPPLRGNPIARAPSSVWSRLVDHTERREAGDTQDTQEEEEEGKEQDLQDLLDGGDPTTGTENNKDEPNKILFPS